MFGIVLEPEYNVQYVIMNTMNLINFASIYYNFMSVQVSFTNKHERYSMNVRVYLSHLWKEMYMYMYDIVASIKC